MIELISETRLPGFDRILGWGTGDGWETHRGGMGRKRPGNKIKATKYLSKWRSQSGLLCTILHAEPLQLDEGILYKYIAGVQRGAAG